MSSEIVPKTPYLIVRNGRFYFDMRVPEDVVGAFKHKFKRKTGTIRESLKTKDRKRALREMGEKLSFYLAQFDELRRTSDAELVLANKVSRRDLSKLSRAELEKLVVSYYRDVLRPSALSPPIDSEDRAELVEEWSDTLARVKDRRDEEGNERVQNTADHVLLKAGWPSTRTKAGTITRHLPSVDVDRAAEQYEALMDLVRRASIDGSRLALAELKGASFTPVDPLFATGFNLAEANDKLGPFLSEALAGWKVGSGVRGSRKPRELTAMEAASAVQRFIELHGDIRIGEVSKKRVQEFASAMSALPARLPKKLSSMALPELLREDLSAFPSRAPATINKAFTLLSAIVEHARKQSDLEDATSWPNHFPSAWIEENGHTQPDRVPFTADDLRRIFVDGPVHGQGRRQEGGQGEAQYWMPLLALFAGARLSELGQLRVCDVRLDDGGVPYLDIGTSGGRTVKTRNSVRRVPVHPALHQLGFLAYVERVKSTAGVEATLWPRMRSAERRARTASWSQWFGNYIRRKPISIGDKSKVFHSFRHLFKDMCRDAGLSEDVHDALTGHAAGKSVGRSYGSGHSVARLYAEISKIKVRVDLTHLHTT
ncbi:site-specific integrase [Bosea vestrisii]|uniref:site-specific integrase n=1 Tax=Bosea vestrisii TaxID=151416 RepID=UPI0024DF8D96|nr:site-specific integrase [Bosea vestrisii]WID98161.1 site-specific integrase [Bosea vestrisii]